MPPATPPEQPTTVPVFLRRVALAQYLFAWVLLLAHGLASGLALPVLGLVPLTGSALLSGTLLHRDALARTRAGAGAAGSSSVRSLSRQNALYCDLFLAGFQLLLLVYTWIVLTEDWRRNSSLTILGTYGTVFMLVDCGIHFYFALKEICHILSSPKRDCPHCRSVQGRGRGPITLPAEEAEYTPLQSDASDKAPRDGGGDSMEQV